MAVVTAVRNVSMRVDTYTAINTSAGSHGITVCATTGRYTGSCAGVYDNVRRVISMLMTDVDD